VLVNKGDIYIIYYYIKTILILIRGLYRITTYTLLLLVGLSYNRVGSWLGLELVLSLLNSLSNNYIVL
jgi:hypothetical protein